MALAHTQAYYDMATITNVESFIELAPPSSFRLSQ